MSGSAASAVQGPVDKARALQEHSGERLFLATLSRTSPSLHFSPPDGRSTRYDRRTSLRLLAVLNVLFKYACARQAARASS